MAEWDGKSRGPLLGYKILAFILRKGGLTPVYLLLYPIVFYYFLFSVKTNKPTYWYFRNIHQFSRFKSVLGVYRSYYSLAESLVDKVAAYSSDKTSFAYTFTGEENLKNFISQGNGGILLSAHTGSWELFGYFLNKYYIVVNLILMDADHKRIKELMDSTMPKLKEIKHLHQIIFNAEKFDHIYAIREALGRKELVCMNGDRYFPGNKTITRNFLGHPAEFPLGNFQLATLFKVPVSMVFGFKESRKSYHLYGIEPIFPEDGESKEKYTERIFNYYLTHLEVMVKKYPYQWFNFYYFWQKT
jgi:predicted LPLAT superfamily acyltransferase